MEPITFGAFFSTFIYPVILTIVAPHLENGAITAKSKVSQILGNNQNPINFHIKKAIKIAYLKALLGIAEDYKKTIPKPKSFRLSIKLSGTTKIDGQILKWEKELKQVANADNEAEIAPPFQNTQEIDRLLLSHGKVNTDSIKELEDKLISQVLKPISKLPIDYQKEVRKILFNRVYNHFIHHLKTNEIAQKAFVIEYLPTINNSLTIIGSNQEKIILTIENIYDRLDLFFREIQLTLIQNKDELKDEIKKSTEKVIEEFDKYKSSQGVTVIILGDDLEHSYKSLNDFDWSCLRSLGQDSNIKDTITKTYHNSLPPDAGLYIKHQKDIFEKISHLERFGRLGEFVRCLSQDENLPEELRNQLTTIAEKLSAKNLPAANNKQNHKFESYLIATIKYDKNPNIALVNAWLIEDNDLLSQNNLSAFQHLLNGEETQQGISCSVHEIEKQLNEFLDKALELLDGKRYNLTIEVFLPKKLMLTKADQWKIISYPTDSAVCWGAKYQVRLRSLERLELSYLKHHRNDWCDQWDKVMKILDQQPTLELFENIEQMESLNWKILESNLKSKIGLKLTCTPPKDKLEDLFLTILRATTPIAIWTRCDHPQLNYSTSIDQVLCSQPLRNLSESVKKLREEAYTQTDAQADAHLGSHLSILWEDPYRLTPNVVPATRLKPPGK